MKRAALLLALMLSGCGVIPGTEENLKRRASNILSDTLFDVESARFRNLRAIQYPGKNEPEPVICGEVNAKNKIGAYVGFSRFVVSEETRFVVVEPRYDLSKQAQTESEREDAATQDGFDASWPPCDGKPLANTSKRNSDEEYARRLERQADSLEALANRTES